MKLHPSTHSNHGVSLLIALFLCAVLSVTIAGYLKHATQQNYLSARSQVWNRAIAVTEAGIEEAMQHINSNTNLSLDGWTKSGSKYSKTQTLDSESSYSVIIDMTSSTAPSIQALASINSTVLAMSGQTPLFAQASAPVSTPIQRAARITAGKNSLFHLAMVAKRTIDMNGNDILTDSFDSTTALNGRYSPTIARDHGDVASNTNIVNSIKVGNANIYGHVSVGPGGTVYVGSQGAVGEHVWQNAGNKGIQDGFFSDDMNFTFESVQIPSGSLNTPPSGSVSLTNYTYSPGGSNVTSSTYPSPVPPTGVTTNLSYKTVTTMPWPKPAGMVTNTVTTYTSSKDYPTSGTYVGAVEVKGNKYYYNLITDITYTYPINTYTYYQGYVTTNYSVTTENYNYVLTGSSNPNDPIVYRVSSLNGKVLVKGGYVTFIVEGSINMTGQDGLTIASDACLKMYVGGPSISLAGKGVMNQNGYAKNLKLLCADTVTSLSISGNGEFIGCVWAPNAAVTLNGGGNSYEDFIGSLVANTIKMNGHYKFHYDESLKSEGDSSRYVMKTWREIPPSQFGN